MGQHLWGALAELVENPALGSLVAVLTALATWLSGKGGKWIFKRVLQRQVQGPRADAKSGTHDLTALRRILDKIAPRLHLLLTRIRVFPIPSELDALRARLATFGAYETVYYLPLRARPVPELARFADDLSAGIADTRRIRQNVRLVLGVREGGYFATPQLATTSRQTRFIRNIVLVLARAKEPLILLGDPGTGKSMTMSEVARTIARRERSRVFPQCIILMRLSAIPVRAKIDQSFIEDLVQKELGATLSQYFVKLRDARRLVVLFDEWTKCPVGTIMNM
jgi:hypothetical protein